MKKLVSCAAGSFVLALVAAVAGFAEEPAKIYEQNCASCHDGGVAGRAPALDTIRQMQADRVLQVMERGAMVTMANRRTPAERRALAEWLTNKSLSEPLNLDPPGKAMCAAGAKFDPTKGAKWTGWGNDGNNSRYQASAGFSANDVSKLKVKWAFAFPGELSANAQPVIAGGRVFVGSSNGYVYSLSAETGCVHWFYQAASPVRGALSIGRVEITGGAKDVAFFGDLGANVYALDAATGKEIWKLKVDPHVLARVTGSVVLHNGRLYVPLASGEEIASIAKDYECCTFRGSLLALNAATGKKVWQAYTIPEEPKKTKKNKAGAQMWGPSGSPIWTAPTIDPQKNIVYVTTGDNYSDPSTATSDAFMAFDRDTGKLLWTRQMTPNDAYTSSCRMPDKTNCPDGDNPDVDFAASAILVSLSNGRRALVAGQKSGEVHAVDPDNNGKLLWTTRVGKGGTIGGIQWGSAADANNIYVALSDAGRITRTYTASSDIDPKQGGGMFAIRLTDGKVMWKVDPAPCGEKPRCSPAQSAAVSAMSGVAFSGSMDGHLRAYAAKDGKVIWDFDSIRPYTAVNGASANGGSFDGPGPAIGGGLLIVNSGYGSSGGMPGNVLLAFTVDGK